VSVQDLKANPQDTSAFYLRNIQQLLANPNVSRASILATPSDPPPFSPSKSAIWVNCLWFLSLVIALTCALLATLLQQWARRYVTATQPTRYSPHKRARVRAFFAGGVEKFHLPWAVELLPALLHLSLFLFFSGLLIFLFNTNHAVYRAVLWWIGLSAGVYVCITLMPIFRHDSPYYAPLSSSAWFLYNGVTCEVFRILSSITDFGGFITSSWHFLPLMNAYRERLLSGVVKSGQETASKLSREIDGRVMKWTFGALDEDLELLQFFEVIPGFCGSNVVNEPRLILAELDSSPLTEAFGGFLRRTYSSSLLSETVKERRLAVCMQAIETLDHPFPSYTFLQYVFTPDGDGMLRSVHMGQLLRSRCHSSDDETALSAQMIVAGIIRKVSERDNRWKALVMDQLGISEVELRDYLAHGDSVLLANWIHVTRQLCRLYDEVSWMGYELSPIHRTISEFDIENTLPGLQHDFCALWNEIVLDMRKSGYDAFFPRILRPIRLFYIDLHQGTDAAPTAFDASTADHDPILSSSSSYPLCNIPGHHPHIDNPSVTVEDNHPTTIATPIVLPPDTITPSTRHDRSSIPALTTGHHRIHLTEESLLHDVPDATTIIDSAHHSSPVNVENHVSRYFTDLTQSPASTDTPTISTTANSHPVPLPAPAVSTFTVHRLFSPISSSTVDPQYNANFGVVPGIPLLYPSAPVPSDTVPANPHSSLAVPVSQTGQVTPDSGLVPAVAAMAPPLTLPQETPASPLNIASNDETFGTHHNSRTPDLSNVVPANST
jgi:hypothetical protein